MNLFDMRTVFLAGVFTEIISTIIVASLWLQAGKRYKGTAFLAASFALYTAAWFLAAMRGLIPDFFAMTGSNTLAVLGVFLGYLGLERFVGKRSSRIFNCLLLAAFPFIHAYYLFIEPSLTARSLTLSIAIGIYFLQYTLLLLYRTESDIRRFTRIVGFISAFLFLLCCLRIIQLIFFASRSADLLKTGGADALFMIIFQMILLLLAYTLVLMVNKRLLANIQDQEEKIRHMANHDALTELPSLRLAQDRLSMAVNLAHRNKTKVAVMFIDLDSFKAVNDAFGHKSGDHVLREVAQRLCSAVRETDTVARVGGDEFLLITTELHDMKAAGNIARKVIQVVSQPVNFDGRQANIGASIGIAFYPDASEDPGQLIQLADEAMYTIKKSGKNGFAFSKLKAATQES